ncbi:GNAT family N-acetyltransferase [Cognatishimia sp. SS12]|uniref:GNAT family N-acetyltransferase n=1 Tax=Cognatishimia sp. SS12 TaxID=2979465 RepID=UPI00232D9A9F|nr:GNAT family N-acetyltransferase [Cognatishimia sp. SS12]MDC0739108.1 GNAT family N-acetyltransferase [Cognatishimia sp. SS12]
MICPAKLGEEAEILEFLAQYAHSSMFLRSNLLEFGLRPSDAAFSSRYWIYRVDGDIRGVFGHSKSGYLMCQCPDGPDAVWGAFAAALIGSPVAGITGPVPQIAQAQAALRFPADQIALDRIEPFYHLPLADIAATEAAIRKPVPDDALLLRHWFRAYLVDTGMSPEAADISEECAARAVRAIEDGKVRLLIENAAPVAMTGLNARAETTVQIGGVFVPKEFRGRGLAGRVLAAHLLELRSDGITEAVLFAASKDAARAYEKIGFQHVGQYQMILLQAPLTYTGPA